MNGVVYFEHELITVILQVFAYNF